MTTAVKLDTEDVKRLIAEYFKVDVAQVIKAQYSYFVEGVSSQSITDKTE